MNIFKNKILIKIIAAICIFLTITNFLGSNPVRADGEIWGGILIKPVTRLLTALSDGIITILQKSVIDQDPSFIEISGTPDWWNNWAARALKVLVSTITIFVATAITITTGGVMTFVTIGLIEFMSISITGKDGIAHIADYLVEGMANNWFEQDIYLPVFQLSPQEIFANKIQLFDINFFRPMSSTTVEVGSETETENKEIKSTAEHLKGVVSKWYFTLRNLALLVLMLVLIYIGIRIVIGSTAGDKAKYKERLMDWCVAVCLVFVMHYIMTFALFLNEKIIQLIDSVDDVGGVILQIPLSSNQKDSVTGGSNNLSEYIRDDGAGHIYLEWKTNLMGRMRIISQQVNEGSVRWVAFSLCYMVLVLYTLFFCWTYLRRVIYMAFLTIIAPLVAMTYPIDKITDGKAQAFSMWLKEYIFNLLIQPVHLLLYSVVISTAYVLANTNPLYTIVAIGFLLPAEKLVRKFFGFEKAQTPGLLGGAAGAAIGMTGLQRMMRFGKNGKHVKNYNDKAQNNKIRFTKNNSIDEKAAIAKENGIRKKAIPNESGEKEKVKSDLGDNVLKNAVTEGNRLKTESEAQNAIQTSRGDVKAARAITNQPKVAGNISNAKTKDKNKSGDEKTEPKKKLRNTLKSSTLAYGRGLKGKVIKDIKKKGPKALIKGATGIATGLTGATAFGMAGLALGLASGDPNKALQYTTAGIAGGYGAGKGISNATIEGLSVDGKQFKDDVALAWHGEDYKAVQLEKEKKQMIKDEDNIQYIRKMLNVSRDEAKEILAGTGGACFDAGITDMADIAAIYKMTQNKVGIQQAMAAQQWNQYLPSNLDKMGEKDRKDHLARWEEMFESEEYENAKELAERAMELAEQFNKAKSSLKKA